MARDNDVDYEDVGNFSHKVFQTLRSLGVEGGVTG